MSSMRVDVSPSPNRRRRAGPAAWGALFGACLTLAAPGGAAAQSLSGTLDATMTLTSACAVSGSALTSGLSFGTLDFGSQPATFTGPIAATPAGGSGGVGATQIVCSPDVGSIAISVSGGDNQGQGSSLGTGARALATGTDYLPYDVFSDSGHTQAFPIDTSVAVPIAVPGAPFNLPIYGLVNKTSSAAVQPGTYIDQLLVAISW